MSYEKYENYEQNMEKFWDDANDNFSHRKLEGYHGSEQTVFEFRRKEFMDKIDWNEKSVLDYGCGGGFMGKQLLEETGISSYIGVDISQKSIDSAIGRLEEYDHPKIWLIKMDHSIGDSLKKLVAVHVFLDLQIFICLAVIHHFPSAEYFNDFFSALRMIKPETVLLSIRHDTTTHFNPENPRLSCYTNIKDILMLLPEYKIGYEGEIDKTSLMQYFTLVRK